MHLDNALSLAERAVRLIDEYQDVSIKAQRMACGAVQVLAFLSLWHPLQQVTASNKALPTYTNLLILTKLRKLESRRFIILINIVDAVYHWAQNENPITFRKRLKESKIYKIILHYLKIVITGIDTIPVPAETVHLLTNAKKILQKAHLPKSRKLRLEKKIDKHVRKRFRDEKINNFQELLQLQFGSF
eukprot:m.176352 g.176352  ORF g.176352 m.176352 type:complete len:188 (+) comp15443_c3_seq5:1712-2275(+)